MDLPDPSRIIDRSHLRLRNKKRKTVRPYLVHLSGRQTEVVLSLITVRDIENITECNYIALGIYAFIYHIYIYIYIYIHTHTPLYKNLNIDIMLTLFSLIHTHNNYSKITHDINSLNISILTLVTLTHTIFDTTPTVLLLSIRKGSASHRSATKYFL